MTLTGAMLAQCKEFTVREHGGLTKDDPLRFRFARTLDEASGPSLGFMRLEEIDRAGTVLHIEIPVRPRLRATQLDGDQLAHWAHSEARNLAHGSVQVDRYLDDNRSWVEVRVLHTVSTTDLSSASLDSAIRLLRPTVELAWKKVCALMDERRLETTVGIAASTAQPADAAKIAINEPRALRRKLVMDDLDQLVGLEPVKTMVRRLAALQDISALRSSAGMNAVTTSPHLVFTGNPGTGKTTVAKLIGRLYASLGLLKRGHVVVADRSTLVAPYLGQTAGRTKEVCEKALGGVLFIDEAYSLDVNGRDYGTEAIEALLTFMEDHRGEFAVVVAGYPTDMARFLDSNPGLRSRFDITIDFPDYSNRELVEIFERLADEHDYRLADCAKVNLRRAIRAMPRGHGFGNARAVRTLFNNVVCNHAAILSEMDAVNELDLGWIHGYAIPVPEWPPPKRVAEPRPATRELAPGYL